ncbi:hypothetical protein [Rhodococcus qingshengii]|uniref:hypothetical protein n=1 Tax=Rhodococcus qingshengii TaxID=334542 RepID=UPI00301B56F2
MQLPDAGNIAIHAHVVGDTRECRITSDSARGVVPGPWLSSGPRSRPIRELVWDNYASKVPKR